MKIVITGATCMLGQALCSKLINKGYEVFAVARNIKKCNILPLESEKMHIVISNMEQYDTLDQKISIIPDVAILLAWEGTRGNNRDNLEVQQNNYSNNMNAIKSVNKLGCHKIIIAGSQAEYGPWYENEEKQIEDSIPHPNTAYGKYKLKLFEDALEFCKKNSIKLYEPRFFSLYGPMDFDGTMVMSMLRKMMHNEPCQLTECVQLWDFLYISDAIEGLIYLIEGEYETGIYNFGYGEAQPLKEYVEVMKKTTNSLSDLEYGVIPYSATGMVNINPDVTKLKSLGWIPRVTFEQGIKEIIREIEKRDIR